jgi:hypothetical protein
VSGAKITTNAALHTSTHMGGRRVELPVHEAARGAGEMGDRVDLHQAFRLDRQFDHTSDDVHPA